MDRISAERRSSNMSRIRNKNTTPELSVRRFIFGLGYRYRLHSRNLPGRPDIVFPSRRKVIFVHGCFWHQHQSCSEGRFPSTREHYWKPKLQRNVQRDREHEAELSALGWKTLTIWECELKASFPAEKIKRFLGRSRA